MPEDNSAETGRVLSQTGKGNRGPLRRVLGGEGRVCVGGGGRGFVGLRVWGRGVPAVGGGGGGGVFGIVYGGS